MKTYLTMLFLALISLSTPIYAAPAPVQETALAVEAIDGDTLRLADGRRVRLDGIDALEIPHQAEESSRCMPSLRRPGPEGADCDLRLAQEAKALLHGLAVGKTLRLTINPQRRYDRYSRILAQIYVPGADGSEIWAEDALLAAGLAYVYPLSGQEIAVPDMLRIEAEARMVKRGIWALPEMLDIPASEAASHYGHYVFITGKVLAGAKTKTKIYLNFGADFRTDFTVMADKHDWKNFRDFDLPALAGHRIRVRGFLHEDNGPMLRVTNPWQIEVLD